MNSRIKDIDFHYDYGVVLTNVNAMDNPELRDRYGVKTVPTFVLADEKDNMIRKISGSITLPELDTFITGTAVP